MKKNKYSQNIIIDAEIDLHGMTYYEAEDAVLIFLKNSRYSGFKNIKIITGKGNHSSNKPVLKNITRQILLQENIKFTTGKIQDGGSGVFIVKFD